MKLIPIMLLIPGASQLQAEILQPQGTFTTVGGNGCQYTKLQEAINAAMQGDPSVIRVVNQIYNENLILDDVDVDIIGGYADCQAAIDNNQGGGSFIINAADTNQSVVTITGDQPSTVHLESMNLTGGNVGIYSASTVNLTLKTITIFNNDSAGAGFMYGNQTVILDDTTISNNNGSGLLCVGSLNNITIKGNSQLVNNTTSGSAGGLGAVYGCYVKAYAPTIIANNQSQSDGGGLISYEGSVVNLYGVTIEGNTAVRGGGITSYNGEINLHNVTIDGNTATLGGGIAALNGTVNIHGTIIQGNNAAGGSAFFATSQDAVLSLTQSTISGNTTEGGVSAGAVLYGARADIENSMVVDNSVNGSTLFAGYGGILNLRHVTLAGNNESEGTLRLIENSAVNIESSIIHSGIEVIVSDDGTGSVDMTCAIINEMATYDGIETISVVSNVGDLFVDPLGGDYHLTFDSPAIDYCETAADVDPNYPTDIDGQVRGVDQPGIDNGGIYDLGADEYHDSDLIFADNFEGN